MHECAILLVMDNLYETTMQKIRDSGLSKALIAKEANVGKRWLHDLLAGRFSDPGVKKIQRIYNFLSNK